MLFPDTVKICIEYTYFLWKRERYISLCKQHFENTKLSYFDEVENLLKMDSLLIAYRISPVDQTP